MYMITEQRHSVSLSMFNNRTSKFQTIHYAGFSFLDSWFTALAMVLLQLYGSSVYAYRHRTIYDGAQFNGSVLNKNGSTSNKIISCSWLQYCTWHWHTRHPEVRSMFMPSRCACPSATPMVSAASTTPTVPSGQSVLVSPTVREKTFIFQITSVVDARLQRNSVWGITCCLAYLG